MVKNTSGQVFYGMHFYPGVAEYEESESGAFRVFINEDTIRKMGPSFAGKPIYVEHVEEVEENLNKLRNEADGWVIESFFNQADGKTWAKFIVVSDYGLSAIRKGWRLSNAYHPTSFGAGAQWNGVSYQKEVLDGEFEHLAIVRNPRYEESVVMTPEQFKAYNDSKTVELKRLANSKSKKGANTMGFNIFKRQKVENSLDLEGLMVELPKSKKEMSVAKVLNAYDTILNMNGYANGDHMVKLNDSEEMSVNDLVKKHMEACNELKEMKEKKENAEGDEGGEPGKGKDDHDPAVENEDLDIDDMGDVGDRGGDHSLNNEEEDDEKDKKLDNEEEDEKDKKSDKDKMKNELEEKRKKAARLKNAHTRVANEEVASVDLSMDKVARGKARYGSGKY